MAKSVPAIVEPRVLSWARKSAGYSLEEAAKKLQATAEKVNSWETGQTPPSIAKVRKMVAVYKRPLHFFFFDEPPVDPPIPHDFRRLPVDGIVQYEPALRFQVRAAYERRQIALDLAADLDVRPAHFSLTASLIRARDGASTALTWQRRQPPCTGLRTSRAPSSSSLATSANGERRSNAVS
jgi:transcriptional regulator with XRE-family HTH domain